MKRFLSFLLSLIISMSLCFNLSSCMDIGGEPFMDGMFGTPNTKDYYIGEYADIGNGVQFFVNSVYDTNKIGSSETDNNYIVVTYTIKNDSDKSWSQYAGDVKLVLDNTEYDYSTVPTFYLDNSAFGSEELNPGLSKRYSIAFETVYKSNEKNYKIKFTEFVLYGESSVSIFLSEKPKQ